MELEDAKQKANVMIESLVESFSNGKGCLLVNEQVIRSTFEHIFTGAYESGKRDGAKLALSITNTHEQ